MNAVSELIKNRRKLVRDVACLAAEATLWVKAASNGIDCSRGLHHYGQSYFCNG